MGDQIRTGLSERRETLQLTQAQLAQQAGLSRPFLSSLESGKSVPSTAVSLRLARILGCRVEDLFWLDDPRESVPFEWAGEPVTGVSMRATVAFLADRWVAHPLPANDARSSATAADALLNRRPGRRPAPGPRLTLLKRPNELNQNVLCAGCAPALGILTARLNERGAGPRFVWIDRPSLTALRLLAAKRVHIAGAHLLDEETRDYNVAEATRILAGCPVEIVSLVRWEAGLAVSGKVRRFTDLERSGLRVVQRDPSAAAQQLLLRSLRAHGLPSGVGAKGPFAASHLESARLVSLGLADAGVTLASCAQAFGLRFIPLASERFDLVLPLRALNESWAVQLLEGLSSSGFRRDAESLGGTSASNAGSRVAHIA